MEFLATPAAGAVLVRDHCLSSGWQFSSRSVVFSSRRSKNVRGMLCIGNSRCVGVAVDTPVNTFPRTVIVFVISAFHLDKLQCARAHTALSTVSVDTVIVMQIGFFLR